MNGSKSSYSGQHSSSGGQKSGKPVGSFTPGGGSQPSHARAPRLIQYFIDGNPNAALVVSEADELGRRLAQEDDLKSSQLRRFYDDVLVLRSRLEAALRQGGGQRETAFAGLLVDFKMLKAKAHYANGRDRRMFPDRLREFVEDHVHSVRNADDFLMFCKQFQAVVAFHRFHRDKKD